ncbi:hypothetical protein BDV93DRAFT_473123 [Ceratobasidium sp. AG-I]|nr:hypothetical protein BDV93DRAFT_473123 [Ceratobasidium sp. AG-I]
MSGIKHPLELLLQNHLGTDTAALAHLPGLLLALEQPDIFGDGPHSVLSAGVLGKWNARISSLLHSREASSRWIGLYLARYTAAASRPILVESAQGWVGVVLPMLSKPEPFPNHHAAIRLLACIFTSVTDMPEFQRQVVIPNVQKCSLALLAFAKDPESDLALKLLAIDTITQLTIHHPTHHRALQQNILAFTLEHLQGSSPLASCSSLLANSPVPSLVSAVIDLHVALPLTGGKVGAGVAWRKSVDAAIGTTWKLLGALRRTYSDVTPPATVPSTFALPSLPEDPAIATPIALDRLRCMVCLLVQLLATPTARPVSMPLGALAQLTLKLIQCNNLEQPQTSRAPYEPIQRVTEAAAIPELCTAGCMLAEQLAQTCGKLFSPYVPQTLAAISFQLDKNITNAQRHRLFTTVPPLLEHTHAITPSQSYTRLAAHLLRTLSPLLPSSRAQSQTKQEATSGERKGKKRARYEADELFSARSASTSTAPDLGSSAMQLHVAALSGLSALFPALPHSTQAIIQRTLLTLLLYLPRSNAQRLAGHVSRVYATLLGEGASGMMGVGVHALSALDSTFDPNSGYMPGTNPHHILQRFLHPRIPSNSGSGPNTEELSLFWKDEEEDEETKEFRHAAGVITVDELKNAGFPNGINDPGVAAESHPANPITEEQIRAPNGAPALNDTNMAQPSYGASYTTPQQQSTPLSTTQPAPTPAPSFGFQPAPTLPAPQPAQAPVIPQNLQPEPSRATSSSVSVTPIASSSGQSRTLPNTPVPLSSAAANPSSLGSLVPDGDDEDEPMPEIDLASDTDED